MPSSNCPVTIKTQYSHPYHYNIMKTLKTSKISFSSLYYNYNTLPQNKKNVDEENSLRYS
jgi:hypothetical protein